MRSIGDLASCAVNHLAAYCDPDSNYAFSAYDRWYGSPDSLTPLDCLAANLLSLRLGHADVIPLFKQADSPAVQLRLAMQRVLDGSRSGTRSFLDLGSIDDPPFRLVRDANFCSEKVRQWTPVKVSKILHRLRPNLVPVVDSVVRNFYGEQKYPQFFARLHQDAVANRELLGQMTTGRTTPDGRPLSPLRALDIVIWHHERIGC